MHLYIWSTMHQIKLTKQTKIETDHQFNYLPTCTTHTFITTAFSWSSFNLHIKSVQIRTKKKSKKAKWRPAPATPALPPAPAAATGASVLAAEYAYTYLHLHTHSFLFSLLLFIKKGPNMSICWSNSWYSTKTRYTSDHFFARWLWERDDIRGRLFQIQPKWRRCGLWIRRGFGFGSERGVSRTGDWLSTLAY